ncbi:MAG: ATP-binding protein [Bacteroidales bacterium]|nr:ATP-binding protein [Bacteroidales bacterium]
MNEIIGRKKELSALKSLLASKKSEFVAVYGRRRVGKTYLIRSAFDEQFSFQVTALGNAKLAQQLTNFHIALQKVYPPVENNPAKDWFTAFQQLVGYIENVKDTRKILFFDELPWFDTHGSGFIQALEHFWNSWASARNDIVLIVCGSAASWMINKLINNRAGLYNRITRRIKLAPFTLSECELFLQSRNSVLDRYQIIQLYMVFGGIPFYWDEVVPGKSAVQNIDDICFSDNGLLRNEYPNLFQSLFKDYQKHEDIIKALTQKAKGITRDEIIDSTGLPNAGSTTRLLLELEESGFIRKYVPFGKKQRNSLYQLVDPYSLFYLRFIKDNVQMDQTNWLTYIDSPEYRAWSGYAFEQVALYHLPQIKHALGISGVQTSVSSWRSTSKDHSAQIDLVIDRRDQVINLCEMKYSINPFPIDKRYAEELRNKIGVFRQETNTRKSVFLTMITTFGLKTNSYSAGLVQNDLRMDVLFKDMKPA